MAQAELINVDLAAVPAQGLSLALALHLLAQQALNAFDRLAAQALADISLAASDEHAELATSIALSFVSGLDQLIVNAILEGSEKAQNALRTNYDIEGVTARQFPVQSPARQLLRSKARFRVDEGRLLSLAAQSTTGLSPAEAAGLYLLPPTVVSELRKGFDYLTTSVLQSSIQEAGAGTFRLKVVIPVLDSETTELCRDRMALQVREWNEMYRDPKTGAEWLHPPFIGAGLPASEAFHYCRSASVPFG